jgi:hypothetical protein
MKRHYQIRKRVICDLVEGECTDEQDITIPLTPDCKNCCYYKEWKESGMTLELFIHNMMVRYA